MSTHGLIEISMSGLEDEAAPAVIDLFDRWGRGGSVIEQAPGQGGQTIKTYLLPEDEDSLRQIEIGLEILKRAGHTSASGRLPRGQRLPEPHIRFLSETDWAEAWKDGYDVLRVGRRLVIKPTWRDYIPLPDDLVIVLDPGMAFGSGLHPTTSLCLETMEDYLRPGMTVLDVGTGSGILAIAAARLGAPRVLALDTDPLAVSVAADNVVLNQVERVVQVLEGTLQIGESGDWAIRESGNQGTGGSGNGEMRSWGEAEPRLCQGWDLVVANILAETIAALAPGLAAGLAPEGILIASGIISERAQAVTSALQHNNLSPVERRDDGDWVALIARRETKDD